MSVPLHVLLLEDRPEDAELVLRELRRAGFEPAGERVATEADYLAHLEASLDIILADYSLPGFSGLRALQLLNERGLDIPFLIVSGTVGEELAVAAMQEGAADYLLKDRLARLGPAVTRALDEKRLRQEKQRADAALRDSEARFRGLMESAPDAIFITGPDHRIQFVNPQAENMFGYLREELLGQNIDLLVPERFRDRHAMHQTRFDLSPHARPAASGVELFGRRKDGTEFPVDIMLSPLELNGELVVLSEVRDITEQKQAAQRLAYQARLLAAVNDAIVASDEKYRITAWNAAAEALFGWKAEEVLGQNALEVLRTQYADRNPDDTQRALAEATTWRGEMTQLHKDGRRIPVEVSSMVLRGESGQVTGFVSVIRDITERRLAEQLLRDNEREMRALVTSLDDIVFEFDEQGTYLNVWARDESLLAPPGRGMLGRRIPEILGEAAGRPFVEAIGRVLTGGQPEDIEYPLEVTGGRRWFLARISPIQAADGAYRSASMLVRDITERKRVEELLAVSERRFRALIENAPDGITLVDAQGRVSYVSPSIERILGYSQAEAQGRAAMEYVHLEDRPRLMRQLARLKRRPGQALVRYRFRHKDGSWRWLESTVSDLLDDPKVGGIIFNYRDITERMQTEAALRDAELRYRLLVEQSPAITYIISGQEPHETLYISPQIETILGYTPAEWKADPELWAQSLHPDDRERILAYSDECSATRQPFRAEYRIRTKDGRMVWLQDHTHRAYDEKGEVQFALGLEFDITERKRVEEALRKSERVLREAEILGHTGSWEQDLITGEIFNTGENLRLFFGDDPSKGGPFKDYTEAVHPDDREFVMRRRAQLLEGGPGDIEYRVVWPDGSVHVIFGRATVVRDEAGQPIRVYGTNVDITERKRAEEALIASEAELRALFASMRDVVLVIDRDGVYRKIAPTNPAAWYIPPQELLGRRLQEIFPAEQSKVLYRVIRQVLDTQQNVQIEYELTVGGQAIWYEASISQLNADSTLWVARDITERKRAQTQIQLQLERLAALRAIDLAITASVDLRVTLNVLLDHVTNQLRVDAASVLLLNSHTNYLEYAAGRGFRTMGIERTSLRLGQGHAGQAALERRVVAVPDISTSDTGLARAALLAGEGFQAYYGVPLVAKGQVKGVLDIFHRTPLEADPEWLDFLEALAGQAALALDNAALFEEQQRRTLDLALAYDATIEGWSRALDLRDKETEGHTQRVTEMTLRLAQALGMAEAELVHVRRGALLHDIGKMGVPDHILLKPGPLTDEEWAAMRKHPQLAHDMLAPITFLKPALDIPFCHHEKWDGTGYPRGLQGEQIPFSARIFAVVDVWDALASDRPYRQRWPADDVLAYLHQQAGKHFDPRVIDIFAQIVAQP